MFDSTTITASGTTLMRQAPMTAGEYMDAAVLEIDKKFGKGYAKAHPELVGAFIQTAALDFGASVIARAIQDGLEPLDNLSSFPEAMRSDHPLMGEDLKGINGGLESIASGLYEIARVYRQGDAS